MSKKIVIFYSSIGHGHISAAQAIQKEINRQDPAARVLLQDIRMFMPPVWRRIDEKLYWFIAKNCPECFENLFRSMQAQGNHVPSLSVLPTDYPEEKVLAYLMSEAPDAVLATHYGAAQVLGTLRERGCLLNTRIGWLHTDFFEGYFPRISTRIDRTFLAHAEIESRWLAAGVPTDKVVNSGMPVRIPWDEPGSRENTLKQVGLATDVPTLLLAGGSEGAIDYIDVVETVARYCTGSIQIIAACGVNSRQRALLAEVQERLRPQITVKVLGLIPQHEMVSYMRAADLLITKAGGMTSAEAFAIGVPTILLNSVSGHERENAAMFVRLGLAELATETSEIGKIALALLAEPSKRDRMLNAQRAFGENANTSAIAQFALDESFIPVCPLPDFGIENGTHSLNVNEVLARLDAEAPADIELLLSYATSQSPQRIVLENPFGHIAIRVGDTVYSANYIADRETDPNLLQHLKLSNYLYGIERPSRSQVHTNTYGMAYGRVTLGLRVAGIPSSSLARMVAEARCIENQFKQGTLRWDRHNFNCADVVVRILQGGGEYSHTRFDRMRLPTMPLDVFEQARALFEGNSALNVDLVAYRQVPGSKASYRFSRFPLSLGRPLRSVARVLTDASRDPLEKAVTKQVIGSCSDRRLCVEDLQERCSASRTDDSAFFVPRHLNLEKAIVADLQRLLEVNARRSIKQVERLGNRQWYGL
jgi:UDP-N-acetylglucosamine:LPS N-acetylglucosamine transferase